MEPNLFRSALREQLAGSAPMTTAPGYVMTRAVGLLERLLVARG